MHGAFLSVSDIAATVRAALGSWRNGGRDGFLGGQGEDHDTGPGLIQV